MAATLNQVVQAARSLSPEQRGELLAELIRDLDAVYSEPQEDIDSHWSKEIARRLEDIDSGKIRSVPAEEVFERLRPRSDEAR
jgi:putative addiction module component (TIGR02574 family)